MKKTPLKTLFIVFSVFMFGFFSQCAAQKKATNIAQNTVKVTPANQAETKEIMKVIKQLFDGMRTSDTTLMRQTFHADATMKRILIDKTGKSVLVPSTVQQMLNNVATPHLVAYDERILSSEVRIDANLATVWAEYEFWNGTKFSHCGFNAFQLIKTEKGWKIFFIADTMRTSGCKGGSQGNNTPATDN